VRQRSKREGWMASPKAVAQRALAKPVTSVSPGALSPADALANVLQEHERETKLSLARSARRMAKDAEQATGSGIRGTSVELLSLANRRFKFEESR
jgi:hypothetical protein